MLTSFIESQLTCTFCNKSNLVFSDEKTLDFYNIPGVITIENLDRIVNDVFGDTIVMECPYCGAVMRSTFKELELRARKKFTEMLRYSIVKDLVSVPKSPDPDKRTLFYCGKCGGFDGKGSCTKKILDECELRRMPKL